MRRTGRADETVPQVFIHELAERLLLNCRESVHPTDGWFGTILQFYLEVVRPVFQKCFGLRFAEDVSELVIFLRDAREVSRFSFSGERFGLFRKCGSGIVVVEGDCKDCRAG